MRSKHFTCSEKWSRNRKLKAGNLSLLNALVILTSKSIRFKSAFSAFGILYFQFPIMHSVCPQLLHKLLLWNTLGNMQTSEEHFTTIVNAKFGGQTECTMGNWKRENFRNAKSMSSRSWYKWLFYFWSFLSPKVLRGTSCWNSRQLLKNASCFDKLVTYVRDICVLLFVLAVFSIFKRHQ